MISVESPLKEVQLKEELIDTSQSNFESSSEILASNSKLNSSSRSGVLWKSNSLQNSKFSPLSTMINVKARLDLESFQQLETAKTPEMVLLPGNLTKEIQKEEDESYLWCEEHSLQHEEPSLGELRCELVQRMLEL